MSKWSRIPCPIPSEEDRRTLTGILTSAGLETRIICIRHSSRAAFIRYIEYRPAPEPLTLEKKD